MSNANSAIKVLRTALKRVQKGWTQGNWSEKNSDGGYSVCLEGAIFGYCNTAKTVAQKEALNVVIAVLIERGGIDSAPGFNDRRNTTKEDVMEVIKLGIIKLETGWPEDEYIDPAEVDDILDNKVDQAT